MSKSRDMQRIKRGLEELRELNQEHADLEGARADRARQRGLLAADLYFIEGVAQERLADEMSKLGGDEATRSSVRKWIAQHSPQLFVMVRRKGDGYELATLPLPWGDRGPLLDQGRRLVKEHQDQGYRIVPSRLELTVSKVRDAAELWRSLEP
ncbi:hypothetical protein I0C86_41060 [Plantactinospora sp. S1510]|uniref:Uncharacterized protein n=1 Tax=Plantactinospora alkalitolerans TaxID=2789879 RepID=A0ABS0H9T1_9ACTN|nr:hypothetical protein [Plantactinospora alkalitolerans]MBF9135242.1 hypothetical protein [Plantactinospora alkalitolerans]